METQSRKEVKTAILIALGTGLVTLACDVTRDVWQDYRKRKKKKQKAKKKGV